MSPDAFQEIWITETAQAAPDADPERLLPKREDKRT